MYYWLEAVSGNGCITNVSGWGGLEFFLSRKSTACMPRLQGLFAVKDKHQVSARSPTLIFSWGLCDSLALCFSLSDRLSPTVESSLVCDKRPESLGTALTRVDVFFRMMHNQALQTSKVMVEVKLVDAPE